MGLLASSVVLLNICGIVYEQIYTQHIVLSILLLVMLSILARSIQAAAEGVPSHWKNTRLV